jgi:hypothetical protein
MAAEVAKKQSPAVKKRKTPLGDSSSADAWMLQVPYAVSEQHQQQQHHEEEEDGNKPPGAAHATGTRSAAAAPWGAVSQGSKLAESSSSKPAKPGLALQQMAYYLGISSCDSSSDGSCDASRDEQHAEAVPTPGASAEQTAAGQRLGAVTAAAAAAGSNNIVSSRALTSRLAPAAAAAARGDIRPEAAAAANGTMVSRGAGGAAVLELVAVAVAVAAEAPTAAAPMLVASAATQLAAMPVAAGVTQKAASQHELEEVLSQQGVSVAHGKQRWGKRSTKSLRRALARLHHTMPPQ